MKRGACYSASMANTLNVQWRQWT
ncbi:hypothetical protein KUF71_012014 [Frankliniella fusca]|uniref:Uncharacterized protein n=1 Tax=Frankliniella fusca TaxID=407009 RepID=A0AAE1HJR5_9NEOP|nr:hypothetical protein KUF71_007268 [Frankliniella fusca]KAK3922557.1 hypothetical protein KUF71_012014 [Frankliniella fusca]